MICCSRAVAVSPLGNHLWSAIDKTSLLPGVASQFEWLFSWVFKGSRQNIIPIGVSLTKTHVLSAPIVAEKRPCSSSVS